MSIGFICLSQWTRASTVHISPLSSSWLPAKLIVLGHQFLVWDPSSLIVTLLFPLPNFTIFYLNSVNLVAEVKPWFMLIHWPSNLFGSIDLVPVSFLSGRFKEKHIVMRHHGLGSQGTFPIAGALVVGSLMHCGSKHLPLCFPLCVCLFVWLPLSTSLPGGRGYNSGKTGMCHSTEYGFCLSESGPGLQVSISVWNRPLSILTLEQGYTLQTIGPALCLLDTISNWRAPWKRGTCTNFVAIFQVAFFHKQGNKGNKASNTFMKSQRNLYTYLSSIVPFNCS